MPVDIPAPGDDTAVRSSVQAFATAFRAALLKRTSSLQSDQAEKYMAGVEHELEAHAAMYDAGIVRLESLLGEVAEANSHRLGKLIEEYYATAYDLFLQTRSAVAFYRQSTEFLRAVTAAIVGHVLSALEVPPPALAVIALGPCGRHEFSPYCRMQLLLVHADLEPSLAEALGRRVHDAYEAIGLRPDKLITPRNPEWRGTPAQWRTRLENGLGRCDARELIQLLRLADQEVLHDNAGLGSDFRRGCLEPLRESSTALPNLVGRLSSLAGGITMMGGVRLVSRGPRAGMFNLLDNALLPLSAAITALSLMRGVEAGETPRRIRELCDAGELDEDLAGQLRETWQFFNELRLVSEAQKQPHWGNQEVFHLHLSSCSTEDRRRLVEGLKTVALLQRHVESGIKLWETQATC